MTDALSADEFARLDAIFQERMQEIRRSPPLLVDVAKMIAVISATAGRKRDKRSKGGSDEDRCDAALCLQAVLEFLMKQPLLAERGDYLPLMRLHEALTDLEAGGSPDLLTVIKKRGRPPESFKHEFVKGIAARAVSELADSGMTIELAARRVARTVNKAFPDAPDLCELSWEKLVRWRERLMEGEGGGGASEVALQAFTDHVPGETPKARGELLLDAIATRGGVI